ncbi:MAG: hypothetical protein WEC84_00745 [Candidatus Andersenbacteria bacterium]
MKRLTLLIVIVTSTYTLSGCGRKPTELGEETIRRLQEPTEHEKLVANELLAKSSETVELLGGMKVTLGGIETKVSSVPADVVAKQEAFLQRLDDRRAAAQPVDNGPPPPPEPVNLGAAAPQQPTRTGAANPSLVSPQTPDQRRRLEIEDEASLFQARTARSRAIKEYDEAERERLGFGGLMKDVRRLRQDQKEMEERLQRQSEISTRFHYKYLKENKHLLEEEQATRRECKDCAFP